MPALAIQYVDYAAWQRRWLAGDVLGSQTQYWRHALGGAPALLELPTDRPRPAQQEHAGAFFGLELDEALTSALKALSRRQGTTLFMTVLTGWATLLARLSGQSDVVVGTPVANRSRAELEPLVGFFVNTLALRLDLSGDSSVAQLLARVKAQALDAQQHQDLPFEQVVEIINPPRSLSHAPLFQAVLAWNNNEAGVLDLPGLRLAPEAVPYHVAKFDLTLDLSEAGERIVGGLEYATALFDPATMERYRGYLHNVLAAMVADDQQDVGRLAIMGQAERHQLLVEWNATDADYPADRCIHELFEQQVGQCPGSVAVVYEDQELTYQELNVRANRLAHHLRGVGVGPDALVGICVQRSLDMVVGLLAVLKAGGAYVPLDPAYPLDRLGYLLEDSAPVVVLTHQGVDETLRTTIASALPPRPH